MGGVPERDRAIEAASGQGPSVGRRGHRIDGRSQDELADQAATFDVPEPNVPILAARQERRARRREGHVHDPSGVFQRARRLARAEFPDPDPTVVSGRDGETAIGADRNGADRGPMDQLGADAATVAEVPQPGFPILTSDQEAPVVGAEGKGGQVGGVGQLADRPAGPTVEDPQGLLAAGRGERPAVGAERHRQDRPGARRGRPDRDGAGSVPEHHIADVVAGQDGRAVGAERQRIGSPSWRDSSRAGAIRSSAPPRPAPRRPLRR